MDGNCERRESPTSTLTGVAADLEDEAFFDDDLEDLEDLELLELLEFLEDLEDLEEFDMLCLVSEEVRK